MMTSGWKWDLRDLTREEALATRRDLQRASRRELKAGRDWEQPWRWRMERKRRMARSGLP